MKIRSLEDEFHYLLHSGANDKKLKYIRKKLIKRDLRDLFIGGVIWVLLIVLFNI